MKLGKIFLIISLIMIIIVPTLVFAQAGPDGGGTKITINLTGANPIKAGDIMSIASCIISSVVKIAAVVVVFFIIYAGFLYVTARGDTGKISEAHQTLTWTVVGALLLLGAQSLSLVVCNTAKKLGADVTCNIVKGGCGK